MDKQNELAHHGVKGQRWGIRRYQNKDGTLTPKGRSRLLAEARKYEAKANTSVANNYFAKSRRARLTQKAKDARYEVRKSDLQKARLNKESKSSTSKPQVQQKKSVKDMTDAELEAYVTSREKRLNLEQRYAALNPKTKSKGKKFVDYTFDNVVKPIATDAAKALGKKYVYEYLGLNEKKQKSKSEILRDLAQDYENRQKIDRGQQYFKEGKYTDPEKKKKN